MSFRKEVHDASALNLRLELESQIATMVKEEKQYHATIRKLEQEKAACENRLQIAQAEKDELKATIRKNQQRTIQVQGLLNANAETVGTMEARFRDMEKQHMQDLMKQKEAESKLRDNMAALQRKLDNSEVTIQTLKNTIEDEERERAVVLDQQASMQIQHLQGEVEELNRTLKARTQKLNVLLKERDKFDIREGELVNKINLLRDTLRTVDEDKSKLEGERDQALSDYASEKDHTKQLELAGKALREELDAKDHALLDAQNEQRGIQSELSDARMQVSRLEQEMLHLEQELTDTKNTLAAASENNKELQKRINKDIEHKDQAQFALRATLAEREQTIQNLNGKMREMDSEIQRLQTTIHSLTGESEEKLSQAESELQRQLKETEEKYKADQQAIADRLAAEMKEQLANADRNAREQLALTRAVNDEKLMKAEADHRARVAEIERQLQAERDRLQSEIETVNAAGSHSLEKLKRMQAEVSTFESHVEKLQREKQELEVQIGQLEKALKDQMDEKSETRRTLEENERLENQRKVELQDLRKQVRDYQSKLRRAHTAFRSGMTQFRELLSSVRQATKADIEFQQSACEWDIKLVRDASVKLCRSLVEETEYKLEIQRVELSELRRSLDARVKGLANKEKELQISVAKVMNVDETMETALTCMHCLDIMENPKTLVPCLHSFCHKCVLELKAKYDEYYCSECSSTAVTECLPNERLDTLCSKYEYRQQAMASLANMVQSLSPVKT